MPEPKIEKPNAPAASLNHGMSEQLTLTLTLSQQFDPRESRFMSCLNEVFAADKDAHALISRFKPPNPTSDNGVNEELEAFFSFVYQAERLRALANHTVRVFCAYRSEELWNLLRQGYTRIPEVVVGFGPNAINYLATRAAASCLTLPLLIDGPMSEGGQFSTTETPVWRLDDLDGEGIGDLERKSLLASQRNDFSLGESAYVQASGIRSRPYPGQSVLAFASRINLALLGSPALLDAEAIPLDPVKFRNFHIQEERLQIRNLKTDEQFTVNLGRLISLLNLGTVRLDGLTFVRDGEPLKLEDVPIDVPGGRIFTSKGFDRQKGTSEFNQHIATAREFAVSGSKKSGMDVCQTLSGQGSDANLSARSHPSRRIQWFSQQAKTQRDFEKCAPAHKMILGTKFPKEERVPPNTGQIAPEDRRLAEVAILPHGLHLTTETSDNRPAGRTSADILVICNDLRNPLTDPIAPFTSLIAQSIPSVASASLDVSTLFKSFEFIKLFKGDRIELKDAAGVVASITVDSFSLAPVRGTSTEAQLSQINLVKPKKSAYSPKSKFGSAHLQCTSLKHPSPVELPVQLGFFMPSNGEPTTLHGGQLIRSAKTFLLNSFRLDQDNNIAFTLRLLREEREEYTASFSIPGVSTLEQLPVVLEKIDGKKRAVARQLRSRQVFFSGSSAMLPPSSSEASLTAFQRSDDVVGLWFHAARVNALGASLPEAGLVNPSLCLRQDEFMKIAMAQSPTMAKNPRSLRSSKKAAATIITSDLDPMTLIRTRVVLALQEGLPRDATPRGFKLVRVGFEKGKVTLGLVGNTPGTSRAPWECLASDPEFSQAMERLTQSEGEGFSLGVSLLSAPDPQTIHYGATWAGQLQFKFLRTPEPPS